MNPLRKRELLLSLKNGTIEACFSVPMLNLTLGNMPFLIAFAVESLGWSDTAIGLLAATPFICLFIQPPITFFLQRRLSTHRIIASMFLLNALPWFTVLLFPWLGSWKHVAFGTIVFLSNLGNALAGVAWSAAISELVPLNIRGRYFGTRNMLFGFWSLVAALAAGHFADRFGNAMWAFATVFALAACSRLIGLFFFMRMRFPPVVMHKQPVKAPLDTFTAVFRDRNFVRLLLFTGLFGLFFNAGQPFYSVFVLKELPLTLGDLVVLTTVQTVGTLISLRSWGRLSDRFGNKPIMMTSALIWLTFAVVSWLVAGPTRYVHLYATYFITGFMLAGFQQIGQFNLMIKMVPPENRAHYLSVYFSFTNLLIAFGPALGGLILAGLPHKIIMIGAHQITSYHVLVAGSLLLCCASLLILKKVREPAARSMSELIEVMRHMREFNPMLAATTIAQYAFTPRGLGKLAHYSFRTLKRQTDDIGDVAEELLDSGLRVIKPPPPKQKGGAAGS